MTATVIVNDTADRVALGARYLGTRLDDRASFAVLDRYVELGGRRLDTSDNYAFWEHPSGFGGQSEAVIGRWPRANPGAPTRPSRSEYRRVSRVRPVTCEAAPGG